jgi:hypothetical protein
MSEEEIITINYSNVKKQLFIALGKISLFYEKINTNLLFFWRRVLDRQSPNRITFALKTLIENPSTALFLNTILFAAVGYIFGGLINQVLFTLAGLNMILFCSKILGWQDKLNK